MTYHYGNEKRQAPGEKKRATTPCKACLKLGRSSHHFDNGNMEIVIFHPPNSHLRLYYTLTPLHTLSSCSLREDSAINFKKSNKNGMSRFLFDYLYCPRHAPCFISLPRYIRTFVQSINLNNDAFCYSRPIFLLNFVEK